MDAQTHAQIVPVGYCAVVMPDIDHYQGCFIIDTPAVRACSLDMRMKAMLSMGPNGSLGALQAALVEGVISESNDVIAAAAWALKNSFDESYFYILAHRDAYGTRTELIPLEASSCEDARNQIHALPVVLKIQQRLLRSVTSAPSG